MSMGLVCHNCGKDEKDSKNLSERMYAFVQVVKVSLTGYYQERTEWERTTFCSMGCLKSFHFDSAALGEDT